MKIISKLISAYMVVFFILAAVYFRDYYIPQRSKASDKIKIVSKPSINLANFTEKISEKPVKLSIPALNINLDIVSGDYVKGTWSLSSDNAHFATITSLPNNISGNTLIYGHNTKNVFLNTKDLRANDTLLIYTENYIFEYVFKESTKVYPNETEIFNYEGEPIVTLLTCNGWNDKYRKLMFFDFAKVERK